MTPAGKVAELKTIFEDEYGWAIDRHGMQGAICEWLSGLPSACTVAFDNDVILALAVKWGSIPDDFTEKQADSVLEFWFMFLANKLGQMFRASPESINKLCEVQQ